MHEQHRLIIERLTAAVHDLAVEKGWWDMPRPIDETFALIHAEASEALEALREPSKDGTCDKCKPMATSCQKCGGERTALCGSRVLEELADVAIRLMDYAGEADIQFWDYLDIMPRYRDVSSLSMQCQIAYLHEDISKARRRLHNGSDICGPAFADVFDLCADMAGGARPGTIGRYGILLDAIRAKHAYNKTRPYRHGKEF